MWVLLQIFKICQGPLPAGHQLRFAHTYQFPDDTVPYVEEEILYASLPLTSSTPALCCHRTDKCV